MGGATGAPLACGLRELAAGRLAPSGVLAPEEIIPAETYLAEVGARCDPPRSRDDLTLSMRSDET